MSPKPPAKPTILRPMPRPTFGNFDGVSPIVLASSCDVLENNSAIPDSGQLSYPFRKPIFIEEIRWVMRLANPNGPNLGSLVSTRMSLGQHYLMRDPVPVWLLAPRMTVIQEISLDTAPATTMSYSHYRWRLPEPLYVEDGQVLSSVFSRGIDGFGSINVQVAYVGRTVPPSQVRPRTIPIPYAASFVTTAASSTYQQSNEKHLFNPFTQSIRVQRLTGRLLNFVLGNSAAEAIAFTGTGNANSIQIDDSWNGKVVGNPTGFSDVFDAPRAAWTFDSVMPPKGVYLVRSLNSNYLVHIGMIGVREEAL